MVKIGTDQEYIERVLSLPRPGEENYLAFYEHRLGAIFKNPRLLLLPMDDHLVHRGDGIFEILQCAHGKIYQLEAHLLRMQRSCAAIDLMMPCTFQQLRELALEVARAAGEKDLVLGLYIGQGPGGFTVDSRECPAPSLYIVARRAAYHPESFWEQGVSAYRSSFLAQEDMLARVKSVNYLRNAMMKREALNNGHDYPLCFNKDNLLSEGATESAVVVNARGQLLVPDCKGALPGTTIHRAMELIAPEMPSRSWPITEEIMMEAKEIILLGTTIDAVGIVKYNHQPVADGKVGPVAKRLRELLVQDAIETGTPF